MKIARYTIGDDVDERWGVVDVEAGTIEPVAGSLTEWGPGITSLGHSLEPSGPSRPLAEVRLLAPLTPTGHVVGVGLNYQSHMDDGSPKPRPSSTLGYLKPRTAIVGPDDEIAYPSITEQLDYEIELVAVMGRAVAPGDSQPTQAVLGYTVGNDVSARDAKSPLGGPDLFSMKGLDRSTPLGPWIVTKDELGGAGQVDVEIRLTINGEQRQCDRTTNMLWPVDELLEYVGLRMTLHAGDVLFTGTTGGVGAHDGRYLVPGDVVESEVSGIGILRNVVGAKAHS